MIKVWGNDDLIEVEGDIVEGFYLADGDDNVLAFSDGTVLRAVHSDSRVWRITQLAEGTGRLVLTQCPENDEYHCSDVAEVHADIAWVVHGMTFETAEKRSAEENERAAQRRMQ